MDTKAGNTSARPANHYVLQGDVDGVVDTTSITGAPAVSLRVGDDEVSDAELTRSPFGIQVTAGLGGLPDAFTKQLVLALPRVNVDDGDVSFEAVAVIVTARTSIGGQDLVDGVVHSYVVHQVHGTASVVQS